MNKSVRLELFSFHEYTPRTYQALSLFKMFIDFMGEKLKMQLVMATLVAYLFSNESFKWKKNEKRYTIAGDWEETSEDKITTYPKVKQRLADQC